MVLPDWAIITILIIILLVMIAAVAGVGYFYGLPLFKNAVEQAPGSAPPSGASTP